MTTDHDIDLSGTAVEREAKIASHALFASLFSRSSTSELTGREPPTENLLLSLSRALNVAMRT